jgi:(1->4)-alpha-D-glucan 1-alpha-D-glucosylmutase
MSVSGPLDILSTYRLQLGPALRFDRVCDLLPYFRGLGITHLYLSPCLKAAAGSTHGYDVVD